MTRRTRHPPLPFRLVTQAVSPDTVAALTELLEHATSGECIGIALAAMYQRRDFIVHTAGECDRNPVFARGMVAVLDDKLSDQIRGRQD